MSISFSFPKHAKRYRTHLLASAARFTIADGKVIGSGGRYGSRLVTTTTLVAAMLVPHVASAQPVDQMLPYMFRSFQSAGGSFMLTEKSRIIVSSSGADLLKSLQGSGSWVQKLRYATGLDLQVQVGGMPGKGDIVLSAGSNAALKDAANIATFEWGGTTKSISENVRNEGYAYHATQDNLTISFDESLGALRGLQNVGQLLMSDGNAVGAHRTLPTGTGLDYPSFETRGVMMDVGRHFVSVKDLLGLMDEMSAAKLNTLHLHLSDNVDATKGAGGANGYLRLYDDSMPSRFKVLKPKDSPSDGANRTYYTKADIALLEEAGARLGIKIVAEIDSPGHSRVLTNAFPDFAFSQDPSVIDVKNPKAVAYVTDAVKEFASWFKTKDMFHVGGDEAYGLAHTDLNAYLEQLRKDLQAAGIGTKQIGAWNNWGEDVIGISNKYTSYVWYPTPKDGLEGRKWLDLSNDRYFVPYAKPGEYNSLGVSGEKILRTVRDALDKSGIPLGGELAVWNDWGERNKYDFDTINAGIAKALPALGFSYWQGVAKDKQGNAVPFEQLRPIIQSGIREYESMRLRERFPYFTAAQALDHLNDTASFKTFEFKPGAQIPDLVAGAYDAIDPVGYDPLDMAKAAKGPVLFRNGMFVADLPGEGGAFQTGRICHGLAAGGSSKAPSACDSDVWSNDIGVKNEFADRRLQTIVDTRAQLFLGRMQQSDVDDFMTAFEACRADFDCVSELVNGEKAKKFSVVVENGFWYDAQYRVKDASSVQTLVQAAADKFNSRIDRTLADLALKETAAREAAKGYVGGLIKRGAGTLALMGNNSFLGGVVIEGGQLVVSRDANLGAPSGPLSFNGGTLVLDGSFDLAKTRAVTLNEQGGAIHTSGHDMTIAQSVTGPGGLVKLGAGTLTLSGGNSYAGSTVVERGTLAVSGGAAIPDTSTVAISETGRLALLSDETVGGLTGWGSVDLGRARLSVGAAGTSTTYAGTITGTGALAKIGIGTLLLPGTNTYTGGTEIVGGTLIAAGGAALPDAGMVTVDKAGRLALLSDETIGGLSGPGSVDLGTSWLSVGADGGASQFTGTISGWGGLTKLGAGTLTLSGANSYLGGTEIGAGTLAVSGPKALPNTGPVAISKTGRLALLSDATIGGLSGSGSVELAASRLSVGADSRSSTYDGSISGQGGLIKVGAGRLNLTGTSSFTGDTRVTGGLLSVNGSLASGVTIGSGATLGGNGRIASLDVASGGTLAPSNSVGTLNVTGNVRFAPGAAYRVEIAPDGRMDSLLVGGIADLNGASLELRRENTDGGLSSSDVVSLLGSHSAILSAAGGVTGRFAPLVSSGLTFIDADLAYSASGVDLSLKRNGVHFASLASSESGRSVATALDGMIPVTPLYETVLANTDASELAPLFDRLSGQIHADMATTLIEDSRFLRAQALDRAGAGVDGAPSGDAAILARDASGASIVYMHGFGSWGRSDGENGNADADRSADGFLAGADGVLDNDWRVGGLVAYGHTGLNLSDGLGSGHADSYALGLYGGRRFESGLTLRAGAGYSHSEIKTTRALFSPGIGDGTLSAKYGADLGQVFGEAGWRFGSDEASIEPFADLAYIRLHDGGFIEDGGTAALRTSGFGNDMLLSTLGVRLAKAFDLAGTPVTARSTLGWRHAYGDATPDASLGFAAGGPAFAIAGTPVGRDAFVVELGAGTAINGNLSVDVAYQGRFATTGTESGFKAGLSWKF